MNIKVVEIGRVKIVLDRRIEWRDENLIEKSSLGENSERIDDKPI